MSRGLRIRFDAAFDGPSWPGPLGERQAVFGEAWLGPMGFLGLLETALGLGAPHPSQTERIAWLVPVLRAQEGFWSRSLQADALGTARRVLDERDALRLCGWRGQGPSTRLEQLARATRDAASGAPDRLEAAARALERRSSGIETLELLDAEEDFPGAWRAVLRAIARGGTEVRRVALEPARARGDLAGARSAGFSPEGDGSLQLVRAHGSLAAADDLAAWLAASDRIDGAVVIGTDVMLDRALQRHGLPSGGASAEDDVLLQVLPLVVEMGWSPPDPQLAHQLLLLPDGPVPRPLRRRLARALQRGPAVDSDEWRLALGAALEGIEDRAARERAASQVAAIFNGAVPRDHDYPIALLQQRVVLVRAWTEQQLRCEPAFEASFGGVIEQCSTFTLLLEVFQSAGSEVMTAPELRRALELAREGVGVSPPCERQAGLVHVHRPDAVCGAVDRIVWWQFERRLAPVPSVPRLSASESAALRRDGVALPRVGQQAAWLARRWRRPLEQAQRSVLLVCPRRGDDGEALYPHPLWEEMEAQLEPSSIAALTRLMRSRPSAGDWASPEAAVRVEASWLAPPGPRRHWHVPPATVGLRELESPSGMATLIGCPFSWILRYVARLSAGAGEPPPGVSPLGLGMLAHAIFHRLLVRQPLLEPQAAAREAGRLLEVEGPRLLASLFLPERQLERTDARQTIAEAARVLFAHIHETGARVQSSERNCRRNAGKLSFGGTPDLVLRDPQVVIDLKWGGRSRHLDALAGGTAVQLAAYSFLASDAFIPVAYFVLRSHELIAADKGLFSHATVVDAPPIRASWDAALTAYQRIHQQIGEGVVRAAGVERADRRDDGSDDEKEAVVDKAVLGAHGLELPAPCHFCDYGLLCGHDLVGIA